MNFPDLEEISKIPYNVALVSFLGGFIVRGFTLSAKEKHDVEDGNYKYSLESQNQLQGKFELFNSEIINIQKKDKKKWSTSDRENFIRAGEDYLKELRSMCNSILADKLHKQFIHGEHKYVIDPKNIDLYYKVVNKLEIHLEYNSKFCSR